MASTDEKRKTINNEKEEIKDARVIANYGDPGLDEDYHFDILSRYVIVMIESVDRIVTQDKWFNMLAIVKRPDSLWINVEGGYLNDPINQQRSDFLGNINSGPSQSPSINGIPRINSPYALGEIIKIRQLPQSKLYNQDGVDPIFFSQFNTFDDSNSLYNTWHTQGSNIPYISNDPTHVQALRNKTISQPNPMSNYYFFGLNKYQYEAFVLNNNSDPNISAQIQSIFDGSWAGVSQVYSANGGYAFANQNSFAFASVEYEDINFGNKQRVTSSECLPLVVTTPNSFPTPKVRSLGTINYNPTYSNIGVAG